MAFRHSLTSSRIESAFYRGKQDLAAIAARTLEKMGKGGVYDQIGGGFHRYSTDERWVVPHFEKMAYDNSELLKNCLHCYQATGKEIFKEIALGIIAYVRSVVSDHAGGFEVGMRHQHARGGLFHLDSRRSRNGSLSR
jgi:uncharacterized protein YyaL (SSP411 family)